MYIITYKKSQQTNADFHFVFCHPRGEHQRTLTAGIQKKEKASLSHYGSRLCERDDVMHQRDNVADLRRLVLLLTALRCDLLLRLTNIWTARCLCQVTHRHDTNKAFVTVYNRHTTNL